MLNVIDIASYQATLVPSKMSTTDGIIVKATGGNSYKNPAFKGHADATLKAGKLLGCYHFACEYGKALSAQVEADHFIAAVKPYVGKATLWLDYEMDALDAYDVKWCKAWLDRVRDKTGATPGIYMSKSQCRAKDWTSVAKAGYPLWVAQYPDYSETGWLSKPWTDSSGYGAWKSPTLFQYTSSGKVAGYPSHLDLDLFYGAEADWKKLAGSASGSTAQGSTSTPQTAAKKVSIADVAARIHADMCDDDRNGYSWSPREGGDYGGVKTLTINGRKYSYPLGSYDCSSSVIKAWQLALQGTPYEGKLDGASYTGNMRSAFRSSGLFDIWNTATTCAVRGDVYLCDEHHTAMCQDGGSDGVYGYDALSEFCINENGEVYGGKVGDQTGYEAYVHAFYEYWAGWDVTLHYNGKADTAAPATSTSSGSTTSKTAQAAKQAAKLAVDGIWGMATTKELQRQLKVSVDGVRGPQTYKALQKRLGVTQDGIFGPITKKALQRKLKVTADGIVGKLTVKALQKALNAGAVAKW